MTKSKARQKGAAFNLVDALGEAGWAEADRTLAQALAEAAVVELALGKLARGKSSAALRQAQGGFALVAQSLDIMARKRGMTRLGEIGATEKFNRALHDIDGKALASARVKILAPGAVKGGEVLVKARVRLAPRRKPRAVKAKRTR